MEKSTYASLDATMTGKRIQHVISESKYSVKDFQTMLRLSCPQPIYRWMKGQTLPSIDNLYMMHRILGIHMEDMLVASDEVNTKAAP